MMRRQLQQSQPLLLQQQQQLHSASAPGLLASRLEQGVL